MKYFLGIYREPAYSPGRHTSNDALILRLVGQALERLGVSVRLASLEEARSFWQEADTIFSMCQGPSALSELWEWKKQGARILNDPSGSLHTYREDLCQILSKHGIPFPQSAKFATDGSADLKALQAAFHAGGWLKRSDVHAMQPEDVQRLRHWEEIAPALERFHKRGLKTGILQQHIEGDEVKFYGVQGGRFFWPFYPKDCIGHPFDENVLQKIAEDAARTLGVHVYGGDAIISPNGTITLIDVNDWPSFAPCRGAAAFAIAQHLKDSYAPQNRRAAAKV